MCLVEVFRTRPEDMVIVDLFNDGLSIISFSGVGVACLFRTDIF